MPRLPLVATRAPRVPLPAELASALAEMRRQRDAGELTHDSWWKEMHRALDAVRPWDDDDEERAALLEPAWQLGALVGAMRE